MKNYLALSAVILALSGCASIIKGGNQNINFMTADGKEADVAIFSKNGIFETQLPRLVSVKKDSQPLTIRVKEDSCHAETVTVVNSHIEPWFWGNIITGGVFGSSTDAATGAMWKYDSSVVINPNTKSTCSK